MVQRIRQSWNAESRSVGRSMGQVYDSQDGMLTLVEVEKPSGQAMLDLESRRAVLMTRQLPAATGAIYRTASDGPFGLQLQTMMHAYRSLTVAAALCCRGLLRPWRTATAGQPPPAQPQQQSEVVVRIDSAPGLPPRIAVPDFIALSNDAETVAAAKTIGEVLWDDLNFRTGVLHGWAGHLSDGSVDRRRSKTSSRSAGKKSASTALLIGTVRKTGNGVTVQIPADQRQQRRSRQWPRNTADRQRPSKWRRAAYTRIRSPTKCTCSSAELRAWRERRSPSRPIATANASRGPSPIAASRTSTSPTTTGPGRHV